MDQNNHGLAQIITKPCSILNEHGDMPPPFKDLKCQTLIAVNIMIFIFCSEKNADADRVFSELENMGRDAIVLDSSNELVDIRINFDNATPTARLTTKDFSFSTEEISAIWFKGGELNLDKWRGRWDKKVSEEYAYFLESELGAVEFSILNILSSLPSLGNEVGSRINRLSSLHAAKTFGIKVPKTLITTRTKDIIEAKNKSKIGKYIQDAFPIRVNGKTSIPSITRVEDLKLGPSPSVFPIALMDYIEQKRDVRTFILDNKFYTVTIKTTKLNKPLSSKEIKGADIVIEKYDLPSELKMKTVAFLNSLKLNTASVDFVEKDGVFYLIDVNPIGEFSTISDAVNFELPNKIAHYLCRLSSKHLAPLNMSQCLLCPKSRH